MWIIFSSSSPSKWLPYFGRFVLKLFRLIESYREFKSPTNFKLLEHSGSPAAVVANVPVIFPQSYPFSLVAKLPPSGANIQSSSSEPQSRGFLNPGLGEIAIVFLALMHSSSRKDLLDFFENTLAADGADNFAQMMSRVFELATSILVNDAFPAKWLNVNIFAHKVILRMMDPISLILRREFIPQQQVAYQFNATLWRESFFMLLTLLSSDQLVIEEFSPQV
jgi:dedicator of cytokinesis protein 3